MVCSSDHFTEMIVWNVGQGQWITQSSLSECLHFDIGGETSPLEAVDRICHTLFNAVYFTHSDLDHIRFVKIAAHRLPFFCIAQRPMDVLTSPLKISLFSQLKNCEVRREDVQTILSPEFMFHKNASQVFLVAQRWLIPGDSPQAEERLWIDKILSKSAIRFLILGHHGSRTSTGSNLLRALSSLEVTVASARRAKYGHPHPQTLKRLASHGLLPLTTEDFGHLRFRGQGL